MCTGSIGVTPNKQGYEKRVLLDKEEEGEEFLYLKVVHL
jgi:hypothetical protein